MERDTPGMTDVESALLRQFIGIRALIEQLVTIEHEDTAQYQHDGYHLDTVEQPVEQA